MFGKKKPKAPESHEKDINNNSETVSELDMRVEVSIETDRKLRNLAQEVEKDQPTIEKYETLIR